MGSLLVIDSKDAWSCIHALEKSFFCDAELNDILEAAQNSN